MNTLIKLLEIGEEVMPWDLGKSNRYISHLHSIAQILPRDRAENI